MSSDERRPLSSSSSSSSSSPSADSHYIGRKEDIVRVGRVTRLVNGSRDILVLHHQGRLYAMDLRCYRMLNFVLDLAVTCLDDQWKCPPFWPRVLSYGNSAIVEFNGRACIVCPWHKYKITLAEGEGLYQAVDDPTVRPLRTEWRSKGVKQRIHQVTEVRGDVYVTLNTCTKDVESDRYQSHQYRTAFCNDPTRPKT